MPITTIDAGYYVLGTDSLPALSATASRDRRGIAHLTMSNLDPNGPRQVEVELRGATATSATGRALTGPAINSINTFEQPDVVRPQPFTGARVANGRLSVTLPPRSVVALELR